MCAPLAHGATKVTMGGLFLASFRLGHFSHDAEVRILAQFRGHLVVYGRVGCAR